MNELSYPSVSRETYQLVLRRVIPATWSQIQLLEKEPGTSLFYLNPDVNILDMKFILTSYLELLIEIAELKTANTSLPAIRRSEKFLGQVFSDAWSEFGQRVPLMNAITELDSYWYHYGNDWDSSPGGVFDEACRVVVTEFLPWSQKYHSERRARIEAAQKQKREAARARLPPTRQMPHDPDPDSVEIYHQASRDELTKWQPRLPGTDGLGNPTADTARHLAEQHLISALTGHWFLKPIAETVAGLRRGCDYAVRGLPHDPALHAWSYEQWQHIGIAVQHQPLLDMLWKLRREDWDHERIRPVNWLVGRIRLLDLLHHDGAPEVLRELVEKLRLGLFVEQLPSELEPDLPLMRNWYHALRGIVLRDPAIIAERLTERQTLLADHWTRGGGIAPASLIDLGGWALLRTARLRGLQPGVAESAYLPREVLEA